MPPSTRPERPPSRPPLTSRIRASFENKRKTSSDGITSPIHTDGFVTQDPEALRVAVDKAINSEAFQTAVAANLAKLIKPSIKDALDTLQPVVEAVYMHEMLLKKTNKSVENILEKMDSNIDGDRSGLPIERDEWKTSAPHLPLDYRKEATDQPSLSPVPERTSQDLTEDNTKIEAKLSELSGAITAQDGKITELVQAIAGIHTALEATNGGIDSSKMSLEDSSTKISTIQDRLDQLQSGIGGIIGAVGSDLGANVKAMHERTAAQHGSLLSSHTTKLDAITTDLAALKGQPDSTENLDAISKNLQALKENVQAGITSSNDHFDAITPQITSIITSVEGQASLLADLKAADTSSDILTAVQKSNKSHEAHAVALGELKIRSLVPGHDVLPTPGSDSPAVLEALAADLAVLIENTKAGLTSNNENLLGLDIKIDDVLTTLEAHRAANQSQEILAAVQKSHESQAAYAEALESIKSAELQPQLFSITSTLESHSASHASHTAAFEGIKSLDNATPDEAQSDLEPQLAAIINTLELHTTALGELRANPAAPLGVAISGSGNLGGQHDISMLDILKSHTNLLNEIKDDVSAEILTTLHDIKDAHLSHQRTLNEVREADVSDEILTALHSSNDSHTNHAAVMAEIQTAVKASNDSHAVHAISLDEIKSIGSAGPLTASATSGPAVVDIGPVIAILDKQSNTLAAIEEATTASNESHAAHATSLGKIKAARTLDPGIVSDPAGAGVVDVGRILATLEEQNNTLLVIKEAANASNDSHAAHSTSLAEMKAAGLASNESHIFLTANLAELTAIATASRDSHVANTVSLDEVKDAVNALKDAHATHTASLEVISEGTLASKEFHTSHAAGLAYLKSVQSAGPVSDGTSPSVDLTSLEEHLTTIGGTVKSQSAILVEVKEAIASASPEILEAVKASHEVLAANHDLLTSHSSLLETIEEGNFHEDIFKHISSLKSIMEESKAGLGAYSEAVKDLHESTKDLVEDQPVAEDQPTVDSEQGIEPKSSVQVEPTIETKTVAVDRGEPIVSKPAEAERTIQINSEDTPKDHESKLVRREGATEDGPQELESLPLKNETVVEHEPNEAKNPSTESEAVSEVRPKEVESLRIESEPVLEDDAKETETQPIQEHPPFHGKSTAVEPDLFRAELPSPLSSPFPNRSPPTADYEFHQERSFPSDPPASPVEPSTTAQEAHHSLASPMSPTSEELEDGSAPTSAIASPLSPSFGESSAGKKGKRVKKPKKGKKTPFVFDPEDEEDGSTGAA